MAQKEFVFKINGQQAATTIKGIQEQIKALDDQIATSNINDPNFGNLVKESDRAKNSLKTLQTEGIDGLKPKGMVGQLGDFASKLGSIPGPIGGVVSGINSMTMASLRFIATPVGAIIAALVIVFKAFQKGIESSEKAQQGLNKLMGAFSGIIGPVIKAVGEFAAVLIDGVVFAIDAVMSGLEALGVDFAKTAKDGMALADTLNQIEEAEGDLEVARAQQNKTLAEAKEILSDTNKTYEERKKALDEIRVSEEKLAAQEVDLARKQVAAAQENIRLYGASKEANDKLDAARIKLANTEEALASKKRQFNKEEKKLISEVEAKQKEADAAAEARQKEALAKAKEYQQNRIDSQKRTQAILSEVALKAIKDEEDRQKAKVKQDAFRLVEEANKTVKNKKDLNAEVAAIVKQAQADLDAIEEEGQAKRLALITKYEDQKKSGLTESQLNEKDSVNKYYDDLKAAQERYYADSTSSYNLYAAENQIMIARGSSYNEDRAKEESDKLLAIEAERGKALLALKDKTDKEKSDKALENLKKQQEAELLVYKEGEEKLRDQILNDKKATDTQKEEAEKRYAENIRAYQQKQLEDQIALLKTAAYQTEEVKAANNLEILRLQDELNQNLKTKYEEDQLNFIDTLNKKVADFLKNNQDLIKQISGTLDAANSVVTAFSDLQDANMAEDLAKAGDNAEKQEAIKKEYFEKNKKVQIAQAIIGAIQGAVGAFTSMAAIPVVGPILGGIAAAAALVSGYANVRKIQATSYESATGSGGAPTTTPSKFAKGGVLQGRKHAEGGMATPFGELEGGEYVINREATMSFLPLLDKINSMGSGSGAPNNLSSTAETGNASQPVIKAYVVASDMTSQQEANKRIADMARL